MKFHVETTVNGIHGPLTVLLPTYQQVMIKIQQDLVEPVYTGNAREISTQTLSDDSRFEFGARPPDPGHDPLRVGPPHRPTRQPW